MPPKRSVTVQDVLTELQLTIKDIGIEATVQKLQQARISVSPDHYIQFVLLSVSVCLKVPVEDITGAKFRGDDKLKYSRAFTIHYLRNEFNIPWRLITRLFDRQRSQLGVLVKMVKRINPRLKADDEWMLCKIYLDEKIKEFKTNSNLS